MRTAPAPATTRHLVDWVARRLQETGSSTGRGVQLHGVTVRDAGGLAARAADAARLSFLGGGDDAGALLGSRAALDLVHFDAAALACRDWVIVVDDGGTAAAGDASAAGRAELVLCTLWRIARLHR